MYLNRCGSLQEQSPAERERETRQEVTRRIKQLGEQRKFKEAVQQLASLAALGVQPDTQAATTLLAACTRSRDMKVAQSVFDQLFGEWQQHSRSSCSGVLGLSSAVAPAAV